MPGQVQEDSLFSLELVVEKVYIPHIACRFPSVAFRLLDFPTILISHVEDDLAKNIKGKIARDPYYELPPQFSELKDKHGNFMIKKGKSCLFKMTMDSLKMHLGNTPLYVMLLDTYPEVPKLLGNSTVPLNFIMDEICVDIAKMGTTVPSVHGDKGLFKLYSLMGKEIGYFVLGFRLLCLGPSLIPHLPDSALIKRPDKKIEKEVARQIVHVKEIVNEPDLEESVLKDTREMGSMTDVEKHDMIIQTLDIDNKAVHVAISVPEEKENATIATQTEKRKRAKEIQNQKHNMLQKVEEKQEDNEFIISNFICPPPLFYNSEAQPTLKIKRMIYTDVSTDEMSVDDLESTSGDGDVDLKKQSRTGYIVEEEDIHVHDNKTGSKSHYFPVQPEAKDVGYTVQHGVGVARGQNAIFPILTALLNELSCIQNPQLLQNVSKNVQKLKERVQTLPDKSLVSKINGKGLEELSKPRNPVRKFEYGNENIPLPESQRPTKESTVSSPGKRNTIRQCAQPPEIVSKNKGWLRKVPEFHSAKKTPLTYRLTNTQRLRLAKTNPQWLETMEKEEAEAKIRKQQAVTKKNVESADDLDVTNFSDTLTEVRRLAEKELEKTGNKTIDSLHDLSTMKSERNQERREHFKHRSKSPQNKKSPVRFSRRQTPSPKHQHRKPLKVKPAWSDNSDNGKKQIVSVEPETRGIKSPDLKNRQSAQIDFEDSSIRSDLPSSQKSIEVRLPSAQGDGRDDSDYTMDEEDEVSSDDTRPTHERRFVGFGKDEHSFPGAINGKPNASLMQSNDFDDQPLESTRVSKNFNINARSKTFESTEDYDTRQFHSTEEPELVGLVSGEDHHSDIMDSIRQGRTQVSASVASSVKFPILNPTASEQSPIPATRRSTVKLDADHSASETLPATSRSHSAISSKRPTPRPRKPGRKLESIHTESVSSYFPSDPENVAASLSSDANYSDDFHSLHGQDSLTDISSPDISMPRFIPNSKLGYTIN